MQDSAQVPNLQTELNYLNSFKSYWFFTDLWSPWSPCCPHVIPIVPTSFPSSMLSQCHLYTPIYPLSIMIHLPTPWSTYCLCDAQIIPSSPCHHHIIYMAPHIIITPPYTESTYPHSPRGRTPRISKISIRFELIKIFQFCLKIWNLWRLPHLGVGVWFGGWVGGWVG